MMNATNTTEQTIATFARRQARLARKLRKAGKHEEANALVAKAQKDADAYRARV